MDDLSKEFEVLQGVMEENQHAEVKNLWQVCFHLWHFYHLLNQKIAKAKDLQEKTAIIERFVSFYKGKSISEAGIPKNQKDVEFDPHLREIIALLEKERRLFGKNLRQIKSQKEGKISLKKTRSIKSKWVKS